MFTFNAKRMELSKYGLLTQFWWELPISIIFGGGLTISIIFGGGLTISIIFGGGLTISII